MHIMIDDKKEKPQLSCLKSWWTLSRSYDDGYVDDGDGDGDGDDDDDDDDDDGDGDDDGDDGYGDLGDGDQIDDYDSNGVTLLYIYLDVV